MAGAQPESGSLPSVYFEVFEWTEARALPPNYKLSGSKPAAFKFTRYTPHFLSSRQALYSPFSRELLASTSHSTPATPIPAYTRIHAPLTFRSPPVRLLSTQSPCQTPYLAPLPEKYLVSLEGITLAAPSPTISPAPGLTREPRPRGPWFALACSPRSDSRMARPEEETPSWPRQASPPSRLGRAAAAPHISLRPCRAQRLELRRSSRSAASEPSPEGNKGSGFQPALARSPPGSQQSPSRCLAPPAWLTHRSPHASCRRGNPPRGPTGAAWTFSDSANWRLRRKKKKKLAAVSAQWRAAT